MKIITFLSDFGEKNWFVAAVKGEIMKILKTVQIVDISHGVDAFDVKSAAFMLAAVYRNFPSGTVHLAVVDPGVGGGRKPLIIKSGGYYFVGPDNGLFSYVIKPGAKIYAIKPERIISSTFHARDLFGPIAAMLAKDIKPAKLGIRIGSCRQFEFPKPEKSGSTIRGEVVHIDDFGNLITSIPNKFRIRAMLVSGKQITTKPCYDVAKRYEFLTIKGSCGYYEISCNQGNAKKRLKAKIGLRVIAYCSKFSA